MPKNAYFQWTDPSAPTRVARGRRFVIQEWQRGVLFQDGRLDTVLGPGPYRRFRRGFALRRVDIRPWVLPVPMQEIPTADGLTVKVSVVGRARVVDPAAFVTASQDANAALYLNAQIATREVIAATTVEQLVASRQELGDALTGAVRGLDELGVALERLELKDVIFSSELKKAQAEVIVARAQGLAALERARGETAALRNLANAAALLNDNPALLQLRLVQQLAATTGHTVVHPSAPSVVVCPICVMPALEGRSGVVGLVRSGRCPHAALATVSRALDAVLGPVRPCGRRRAVR